MKDIAEDLGLSIVTSSKVLRNTPTFRRTPENVYSTHKRTRLPAKYHGPKLGPRRLVATIVAIGTMACASWDHCANSGRGICSASGSR